MEDLNDKVTGGTLTAPEWNQVPSEIQNVIENTGQSLTNTDLNQLGKGLAEYAGNGDFYTDSGAVNAYTLSAIGLKQSPPGYVDGMIVRFLETNVNTGASTVNLASLGVKNIFRAGVALSGGEIDGVVMLRFDLSNDRFELLSNEMVIAESLGDIGFRVYSSGRVEEWGFADVAATTTGNYEALITLPLAMPTNITYVGVTASEVKISTFTFGAEVIQGVEVLKDNGLTQINLRVKKPGNGAFSIRFNWKAEGF